MWPQWSPTAKKCGPPFFIINEIPLRHEKENSILNFCMQNKSRSGGSCHAIVQKEYEIGERAQMFVFFSFAIIRHSRFK